ncbi:hypothetical protein DPMN_193771 [Dreissena polymorpha]|uniref:Uncharacterized protein n=1 Tax=Dreissena polymorpha TaxID=45954 RepID=A0A9D4BEZ0_DREPO|nr:hypothetical protein DPMN_193771 [Dreissena polymorpha]
MLPCPATRPGSIADITNKQKQLDTMFKNMKHVTTTEDAHVAKELKLPAEITDLKCRSMRDNLLVFSIPEENNENCDNKIVDLIVRHKTSYTKCIRFTWHTKWGLSDKTR